MNESKKKYKYLLSIDHELFMEFIKYSKEEYKSINGKITELILQYIKQVRGK